MPTVTADPEDILVLVKEIFESCEDVEEMRKAARDLEKKLDEKAANSAGHITARISIISRYEAYAHINERLKVTPDKYELLEEEYFIVWEHGKLSAYRLCGIARLPDDLPDPGEECYVEPLGKDAFAVYKAPRYL